MDSVWLKPQRSFKDLREFLAHLESRGELKTIDAPVSPALELTEISRRVLAKRGPALLFTGASSRGIHVLSNLFGTEDRVAAAIGHDSREALTELGRLLAALRAPQPPRSVGEAWRALPLLKEILNMAPKTVRTAPCQEVVVEGAAVDLADWPIQTCWPDDVAPLITWGLTTTRGPLHDRQNLGIYRQQVIGRNKIIMRWLAHRGGATDYQAFWAKHPGERFPVAVSLGADPATILAAVTPIPNTLSEYAFAGLLRGGRSEVVQVHGLGAARAGDGRDHARGLHRPRRGGARRSVRRPHGLLQRGRALSGAHDRADHASPRPDLPHDVHGPSARRARDPGAGAQRRVRADPADAVSRDHRLLPAERGLLVPGRRRKHPKEYPGHAKRVMFGVWSFLRQFMYTKIVIVVDDDIDARHWTDVIWAISTRVDPKRDSVLVESTPIDYLDFASPVAGLGSKLGIDATTKWPGEVDRQWGRPITMRADVVAKVDRLWSELGLG